MPSYGPQWPGPMRILPSRNLPGLSDPEALGPRPLIPLILLAVAAGCDSSSSTEPDPPSTATLEILVQWDGEVEESLDVPGIDEAFLGSDSASIRLLRGATPVVETVVPFSPTSAAPIPVEVELQAQTEGLALTVELLGGPHRLFSGALDVELSLGESTQALVPLEPILTGLEPAAAVASGSEFTCALSEGGQLFCWGRTDLRRGEEDPETRTEPAPVTFWPRFIHVTAGDHHACALAGGGELYCWGWNGLGQLGDGTTTDRAEPTRVNGDHTFAAVDAGSLHTCAVTAGGAGLCWGGTSVHVEDFGGGMGYDLPDECPSIDAYHSTRCSMIPRPVDGGLSFSQISAGVMFSCGVTAGGTGYCWGWDRFSQLGVGADTVLAYGDPQPIAFDGSFQEVQAGGAFACGIDQA